MNTTRTVIGRSETAVMPHLLRYKLTPGERLIYQQETAVMVERFESEDDEEGAEVHSSADTLERTLRVLKEGEGFFEVEVITSPGDEEPTRFSMNAQGGWLDEGQELPLKLLPFPEEPVEAGDSWTAEETDPASGASITMEYIVESLEERPPDEGGWVAQLVAMASFDDPEEGSETEVNTIIEFSVTAGHQLSSSTIVETIWEDGTESRSVSETKLKSRVHG